MNRIYTYAFAGTVVTGEDEIETPGPVEEHATLDLDKIVAIKTPRAAGTPTGEASMLLVQTTGPKGIYLPYNAEAVKGLIDAWKAYHNAT